MKARIYLLGAAVMWGLNFHLLEHIVQKVHFMEAGFWRYLFAAVALGVFVRKPSVKWTTIRQNVKGILVVGVLGLFCFNIFLFWGLQYTSALNASLIMSLNPIASVFFAHLFLKIPSKPQQLTGACIGVAGVIGLLTKGDIFSVGKIMISNGDLLVAAAMILSAFYHIWVKRFAGAMPNLDFTFLTTTICLISYSLVLPLFSRPQPLSYDLGFWAPVAAFGVLGTALTYLFWNKGIKALNPDKAAVFMNVIPLSTALFAVMLGKELAAYHLVSGMLILSGLMFMK